jgi:hypothetical protein
MYFRFFDQAVLTAFHFHTTDAFVFHSLQTTGYVEKKPGALQLKTGTRKY